MQTVMNRLDPQSKDDWITDNDIPDPEVMPQLSLYHVLVRPQKFSGEHKVAGTTKSIIMPDKVKDDVQFLTNVGRIVAKGPSAFRDTDAIHRGAKNPYGKFGDERGAFKEGDYVVWAKSTGIKIKYKGIMYVLLNDDELLMRVDTPEDINPMDSFKGAARY